MYVYIYNIYVYIKIHNKCAGAIHLYAHASVLRCGAADLRRRTGHWVTRIYRGNAATVLLLTTVVVFIFFSLNPKRRKLENA